MPALTLPDALILPPARLALRHLPARLHAELLARACAVLFSRKALSRLAELEGRTLGIVVRDAPCELEFVICHGRLSSRPAGATPCDLRISGGLDDFWLLASRREDPDTLFFERRLSIEGDTELGLAIKNLLDALEPQWPAPLRALWARLPAALRLRP